MIRLTEPAAGVAEQEAVAACIASNELSSGDAVEAFEASWADVVGTRYCVAVGSGTLALTLAIEAVVQGRSRPLVLAPEYTCAPTVAAICRAGGRAITIDCERVRFGMDPAILIQAIKALKLAVVVPVHVYGAPVQRQVFDACRRAQVPVVEDACEAHGATLEGAEVGRLGRAAAFSFRGDKMITTGGVGGAVTTDERVIAGFVRCQRDLYLKRGLERYFADGVGVGCQMGEMQAAFGRVQIGRLSQHIEHRRRLAGLYWHEFSGSAIEPPAPIDGHVWWRYMVLLPRGADLLAVANRVLSEDVEVVRAFTPMSALPLPVTAWGERPVANELLERGLCLPIGPHMNDDDVVHVADVLKAAL